MRVPDSVIRAVLEQLAEEVAVCDGEGRVVRANEAWKGARPGGRVAQGFEGQDLEDGLRECRGRPLGRLRILCRRNASWVWVSLSPLVDEFRDFVGILAEVSSAASLESRFATAELTPREREVAFALLQGRSTKEIAGQLHLSEATVKTHTGQVYRKTGARSRHELAALADS